jgi:peptidoglycan/LPS O-acetylase OafA/YrhL
MASSFFEKFRRVTASTAYLPEVDGLRFLAVFWVAIIMHTTHYLDEKFYNNQLIKPGPWKWVVLEGAQGMSLFFMISGFILSLPFAKAHLKNEAKVSLKRYYLRRVTRLEAPYIIALLIFFLAHIFVIKKYTISQLVPSLLASTVYLHDLIYGRHSVILPVAWSLEVEVHFYILAPILCMVFKLRSMLIRRIALLFVIAITLMTARYFNHPTNFSMFLPYFFSGLLLSDLYVCKNQRVNESLSGYILGIFALVALLAIPSYNKLPMMIFKLIVLFVLFYQVLFNSRMKAMFSVKGITLIGGMCYSIYLLHFGIISCFGTILLSRDSVFNYNHAPLYLILITLLILLISAAYFYYIEKPFMRFRLKQLEQKSKKEVLI